MAFSQLLETFEVAAHFRVRRVFQSWSAHFVKCTNFPKVYLSVPTFKCTNFSKVYLIVPTLKVYLIVPTFKCTNFSKVYLIVPTFQMYQLFKSVPNCTEAGKFTGSIDQSILVIWYILEISIFHHI